MSIALDFALFMRNSKTKLNLSLTAEAIGFKLAFRIGSNSSTWISHEALALEAGITDFNLSRHTKSLVKSGIIKIEKQKKDKRKNLYSFNDVIFNYHQMNDQQKNKIHQAFGDEMIKNKSHHDSITLQNRGASSGDTPQNRGVNTPQNRGVILDKEIATSTAIIDLNEVSNSPKEKEERKKYKQRNRDMAQMNKKSSVNLITFPDDFFPDDERRELLSDHAKRTNNTEIDLLRKFETVSIKYKTRSTDWQKSFEDFLVRELPKRIYENSLGQKRRYDGQSTHY